MATATLVLSGITLALVLATVLLVRATRADNEETRRALQRLERQLGATAERRASVGDQTAPTDEVPPADEPAPAEDSALAEEEPGPAEEDPGRRKWREAPVTDIWGQPLRKKPRRR